VSIDYLHSRENTQNEIRGIKRGEMAVGKIGTWTRLGASAMNFIRAAA
jgi:hypothetical protein